MSKTIAELIAEGKSVEEISKMAQAEERLILQK